VTPDELVQPGRVGLGKGGGDVHALGSGFSSTRLDARGEPA
jgi:hypothetical protein